MRPPRPSKGSQLYTFLARGAKLLDVAVDASGLAEIARRGRGTPRVALRLLRRVRDYAQVRADGIVTEAVARDALDMQGIDPRGLDAQDRKYLTTIARVFGGGPVGVEAVAHTMNLAPDNLIDEVEPFVGARLADWAARCASGVRASHG